MGYTTEFTGKFELSRPATAAELSFINTFCGTRRMKRDVSILMELYKGEHGLIGKPILITKSQAKHIAALEYDGFTVTVPKEVRTAAEIYGIEGEYFCCNDGQNGQRNDRSIIDYDSPAKTQPGLWCQWEINEDGMHLQWNGAEKFYAYVEWLQYLIKNFFEPWGIKLNGKVNWEGEDSTDLGLIEVTENVVTVKRGTVIYM